MSLLDFYNISMRKLQFFLLFAVSVSLLSCHKHPVPREYGYYRIDLPEEHSYAPADLPAYPYSFSVSEQANLQPLQVNGERYWLDIEYPQWNAIIHCSYKPVRGNLRALIDDANEFVFSHAIKASSIPEHEYADPVHRVYGLTFELEGNTASSMQFFLTDSVRHFFRGSLYFNNIPNQDSIAPVANYIREDIVALVESFRWTDHP